MQALKMWTIAAVVAVGSTAVADGTPASGTAPNPDIDGDGQRVAVYPQSF